MHDDRSDPHSSQGVPVRSPERFRAVALHGTEVRELTSVEAVRHALHDRDHHGLWIDLAGEASDDVKQLLTDDLGVHALTVEDVFTSYVLPKAELFDSFLYVLVHAVRAGRGGVVPAEVDLLLGARWLVTHHEGCDVLDGLWADRAQVTRLLQRGPAWLLHALLDRIVDDYFPAVERYGDELEALETLVLQGRPDATELQRVFRLRATLLQLRRLVVHEREIFLRLARRDYTLVPDELTPFFRDVFDHFARIGDLTEAYREMAGGVLEMHLSLQSNRMNEVMKVLTMFSTIVLPLTLIAGIYGMNFEHMPELRSPYGYPTVLAVMAVSALGMVGYFRRKGWL